MIIGIDIDDVLAEFMQEYLKYHNGISNSKFTKDDIFHFDLKKSLTEPEEEILRKILDFYETDMFENLPATQDAKEAIEKLNEKHELHAITARPESTRARTERWICKNFKNTFKTINFSNDFELSSGKKKHIICKDLKTDIMIEDSPVYADAIQKEGVKVLFMSQPWNKEHDNPELTRVHSWKEILDIISSLSG